MKNEKKLLPSLEEIETQQEEIENNKILRRHEIRSTHFYIRKIEKYLNELKDMEKNYAHGYPVNILEHLTTSATNDSGYHETIDCDFPYIRDFRPLNEQEDRCNSLLTTEQLVDRRKMLEAAYKMMLDSNNPRAIDEFSIALKNFSENKYFYSNAQILKRFPREIATIIAGFSILLAVMGSLLPANSDLPSCRATAECTQSQLDDIHKHTAGVQFRLLIGMVSFFQSTLLWKEPMTCYSKSQSSRALDQAASSLLNLARNQHANLFKNDTNNAPQTKTHPARTAHCSFFTSARPCNPLQKTKEKQQKNSASSIKRPRHR